MKINLYSGFHEPLFLLVKRKPHAMRVVQESL